MSATLSKCVRRTQCHAIRRPSRPSAGRFRNQGAFGRDGPYQKPLGDDTGAEAEGTGPGSGCRTPRGLLSAVRAQGGSGGRLSVRCVRVPRGVKGGTRGGIALASVLDAMVNVVPSLRFRYGDLKVSDANLHAPPMLDLRGGGISSTFERTHAGRPPCCRPCGAFRISGETVGRRRTRRLTSPIG